MLLTVCLTFSLYLWYNEGFGLNATKSLLVIRNLNSKTLSSDPIYFLRCTDYDECGDPKSPCGVNEVCYNNIGSYECKCQGGYRYQQRNSSRICQGNKFFPLVLPFLLPSYFPSLPLPSFLYCFNWQSVWYSVSLQKVMNSVLKNLQGKKKRQHT